MVPADYVFEPDYPLMTLAVVERHIQADKHLPGILSAAEIEGDGVAVRAMQTKLLEKVEELMLYTIQQQKNIETLERALAKLEDH